MTTIDGAGEPAAALDDAADQELVLRSRSGDRAAFGELWRRHYRAGIAVARSMTSSLDSDDLVQEAYARIYQSILRGGGPTGSFRAYLFTSIRNTAAGWGRARRETTTDDLETMEDPATSDRATEDALDRSITVRAFRSLPSRWQEALWYSEIEGMKPAEVAPLLGMKPTAVAQLTFRAREGLREAWIQAHLKDVANGSDCQWTIERLGAFARSNLGRRDQARAEAHLADCPRCSIVASEAKDVSRRLTLVLLPLTVGVTGTAAYLATVQGGGSSLVALAAMPSGVVHGTVAMHGGTGLAVAGTGFGATGSGVATVGAGAGAAMAGTAGAAGTVAGTAAATAGLVAAGAAGGGLLSTIGGMVGVVVAGAVLVGSAASGIALQPAVPAPSATTHVATELLPTGVDETGTVPASAGDSNNPTEGFSSAEDEEVGSDGTTASRTGDPTADGTATGSANGTGPGSANGTATGSANGTGPRSANGTGPDSANGTATGTTNGPGPGSANGTATGHTDHTAPGAEPATTADGSDGEVRERGSYPQARVVPPPPPAGAAAAASAADRGAPASGLAPAAAPGAAVQVPISELVAPSD
ncbi:sigma-70 family RNA polymerase sigma factor [Microbacterium sp. P5_E9]